MQLPSDILPVEWAHCSPFGMFCAECKVPLSLDYKLMKRHAERNHEDGNKYSYEELKTTIMLANSIIDHLKDENVRPYLVGEPKTACQCSICNAIVLDSKNFARHKKSKSGCSEGKIMHITVQDTTCFRTIPVEDVAGVPRGAEIPFERTKDWLLPIMPEEEEVQPYVAYMHHFTLLGDAQSVIKGKLAMIDTPLQPEEKMLGFVIERSKEWLFNQARTISESIPAHYRSQLANAGGGQAFDDTTSNTTYCFRHKEEYMWTEMEKLLKFAWRHGSVHDIVTSHIATFGAYKTVPGHASRLLTYLMYEESGTTWEHTLLFEYVLVRMFRKNSDGKLYIVKSQSSSKMAACVLSLCRAAVCTFLALSGNYIVPMAEWLLPLVRRGYFTNMVCPLIRKMRDLDNNKCSTSLTTFAPDGSVFHKDLEFKHEVWKRLIPKTTSIIEDCIKKIVDPESKLLKIMDAKKVSVSLTSWTDFEMTTEDSNIVTNKDIILKEDFEFLAYDKLHAAFELVFAGMGAGSARLADVSHTKDYQGKLHMGSVYYFTATNKVGNQRQHTTQKKFIKHKLCKEHSVLFLIYKAVVLELYKRRPFEFINGAEDSLLPKREGNVFGMCDMVCELFNFTRTPTSQEVRQFFTSLVDIIFPSGDTDARVAAKADAADLCSHSLTTHRRNYQTQLVGGEEVMFEIWHEQLGARPSELLLTTQDKVYSVGDLKKYLMQLHGHDAKWTCREQEQLVNLVCNPNGKHTLAVLSCGMGKSIAWMFLCLISRKMNVVVAPYKFLAGYLSSSLLDKLKSKKGVKVVAFTGREINESQLPSELEGEDLPQVLFVTLEAISNLITYHSQEVKNWKDSGNLGHFFIDEIHTLITEFEFREVYDSLKNLSQFGVPVTALTGTLPVQAATGLCRALNLSSDNNSNDCNHIRSNFLIGKFPAGFKFDVMIFENQDQLTEKTVQIANSPLLEVEPGLEPRAIHIICDTKSNAAAIYQLFKKKATCEMVTSSNTYEEQESICAKWREGTTRVLVSTTCALVGNENRLCQHVIIVGWPYNVMNLVQAMGRLRPLQRTEKGSITILLNKIVPVERNPKWKLNEAALHRVLESGLLRNQGEYEDICTVRGLYKWATNKTDCRIKTLSQMFGYTEDVCGVCDTCRSTSVARISNTRTVQNNQRVVTNNRAYCIFKMVEHRCVICTSSECIGMCYKYSQCCKCGSNDHQAGWCPYKTEIKNALQGRGCFTCYDNRNRKGYERHEARGKCPTKERLKRILNYGFEHSDEIDYVKYLSLAFKNVDSYCTHVVDIFDKRKDEYSKSIENEKRKELPHILATGDVQRWPRRCKNDRKCKLRQTTGEVVYLVTPCTAKRPKVKKKRKEVNNQAVVKRILFSQENMVLHAVQVADNDDEAPLLPPNRFRTESGEYIESDKKLARSLYKYHRGLNSSRHKHRKFVPGALHTSFFEGYHYIDTFLTPNVDIVVRDMESGKTSVIKLRHTNSNNVTEAINNMMNLMPATGTVRKNLGDFGHMYAVGVCNQDTGEQYAINRINGVNSRGKDLCLAMRKHLESNFKEDLDVIDRLEKNNQLRYNLDCLGDKDHFITRSYFFSKDYCNSTHIDCRDRSNSIITWSEEHPGQAEHWRFVFPNLRINGSDGVVFRIRHGLSMSIDGKIIRHNSAKSEPGIGNHVYGCAYASTS